MDFAASGWTIAKNILLGLVQPDLNLLFNFTSSGVLYLLIETIAIAFLGTIVGAILAIPLAFLSASNLVPKACGLYHPFPAYLYPDNSCHRLRADVHSGNRSRAICWCADDVTHSIGMLSKLYVDVIEDLDTSVLESMESIGCTVFEKIRFGIIPQLSALFLSIVIYRFDMNLRDSAVLGLVGAGGIGAPLIFAMNSYKWSEVGAILIGLVWIDFNGRVWYLIKFVRNW